MAVLALLLTPPDTPDSQCDSEDRATDISMLQRRLVFPDTPESPEAQPDGALDNQLTASSTFLLPPPQLAEIVNSSRSDMKLFASGDPFSDLKLDAKIAEGQWGNVFKARFEGKGTHRRNDSGIGISDFDGANAAQGVLAVKKASGKNAIKTIQHEARILSFLTTFPSHQEFVVPFYGYDMQHRAVIMQYIPRTLEDFVVELEQIPDRENIVENSVRRLAKLLVEGLQFIHDAGVIHGDIKPSNILLQGNRREFMQPVYCDFTASRLDKPDSNPGESVGTYDFMAPELFTASTKDGLPTFASDVYGLGVTLLHVITGRSPFEDACNVYMRRAMAMQGTPLQFISSSLKSLKRLQDSGLEPLIDGAVRRQPHKRWSTSEWAQRLRR